jgi:hypothetical protein
MSDEDVGYIFRTAITLACLVVANILAAGKAYNDGYRAGVERTNEMWAGNYSNTNPTPEPKP